VGLGVHHDLRPLVHHGQTVVALDDLRELAIFALSGSVTLLFCSLPDGPSFLLDCRRNAVIFPDQTELRGVQQHIPE